VACQQLVSLGLTYHLRSRQQQPQKHCAQPTWEQLRDHFDLAPHPEGGFFVETYLSNGSVPVSVLPDHYSDTPSTRPFSTAIYYLLRAGNYSDRSHLHMLAMDEVWHFYLGGQLTIVVLDPADGSVNVATLGRDVLNSDTVQFVVPAQTWFGAFVSGGDYAFVGTTNAPGFVFEDWQLGNKTALLDEFPDAADWIELLAME
jgi:predicted cupin superfamily sugar epimerase